MEETESLTESGPVEIDAALAALRDRGFAVIESVFGRERIAALVDALADIERVKPLKPHQPYLPLVSPLTDDDIARHPRMLAIIRAALGDDLMVGPVGLHRQEPGDRELFIHRDRRQLFDLPFALPVYAIVIQIALSDFTEENGATEVWPGSQWLPDVSAGDRSATTRRAEAMPSCPLTMSAGDVCLRDARLWHRAGANRDDEPRSMLVVQYERDLQQSKLVRFRLDKARRSPKKPRG